MTLDQYILKDNTLYEFIKYDYYYNDNKNINENSYILDIYINTNKSKFLEMYFNSIFNENEILNEGILNLVKSLIKFIYDSTKTLMNVLKKLGKNDKVEKITDKIKQDKETMFALKGSKFILKMGVSSMIYRAVSASLVPYTSAVMACLTGVGCPGIVGTILIGFLTSMLISKSWNAIKKGISLINGAIKKWAYGQEDENKVKEESIKLAMVALNQSYASLSKIEDKEKREQVKKSLDIKKAKLKEEINKLKNKERES